jgi:hypothetical protein
MFQVCTQNFKASLSRTSISNQWPFICVEPPFSAGRVSLNIHLRKFAREPPEGPNSVRVTFSRRSPQCRPWTFETRCNRNGAFFDLTRIHFCVPAKSIQPTGETATLTQQCLNYAHIHAFLDSRPSRRERRDRVHRMVRRPLYVRHPAQPSHLRDGDAASERFALTRRIDLQREADPGPGQSAAHRDLPDRAARQNQTFRERQSTISQLTRANVHHETEQNRSNCKTHVLTPKLDRDSMHVWLGARIPCC